MGSAASRWLFSARLHDAGDHPQDWFLRHLPCLAGLWWIKEPVHEESCRTDPPLPRSFFLVPGSWRSPSSCIVKLCALATIRNQRWLPPRSSVETSSRLVRQLRASANSQSGGSSRESPFWRSPAFTVAAAAALAARRPTALAGGSTANPGHRRWQRSCPPSADGGRSDPIRRPGQQRHVVQGPVPGVVLGPISWLAANVWAERDHPTPLQPVTTVASVRAVFCLLTTRATTLRIRGLLTKKVLSARRRTAASGDLGIRCTSPSPGRYAAPPSLVSHERRETSRRVQPGASYILMVMRAEN